MGLSARNSQSSCLRGLSLLGHDTQIHPDLTTQRKNWKKKPQSKKLNYPLILNLIRQKLNGKPTYHIIIIIIRPNVEQYTF